MSAYYNENDPKAAAWLRELIADGFIPKGRVDERSISDVVPSDLDGFAQCHFFAGIGGWAHALALAGWPEDKPVWTGSCPCQPFSAAGRRGGVADERHLWPHWFHLIDLCRPPVVFGEQVASKDGLGWLDLVSADLEGAGYAFAAADMCAAGVGAPHIRQRLWFVGVADAAHERIDWGRDGRPSGRNEHPVSGSPSRLADADRERHDGIDARIRAEENGRLGTGAVLEADRRGEIGGVANASSIGQQWRQGASEGCVDDRPDARRQQGHDGPVRSDEARPGSRQPGPVNKFWRDADWLYSRDDKWRPVEPGTFPLAHGVSGRVGLLRGYGNAIVPEVAATFIEAVLPPDIIEGRAA